MRIFRDYIRIAVFFAGALAGLQVPAFIDLYGDTLRAHLVEAEYSLLQFQDEADRFFGGNIDALVDYYMESGDRVFQEGGSSIGAIARRYQTLAQAQRDFTGSWLDSLRHVALNPMADIRRESWSAYDYSVRLTAEAMLWGVLAGLLLSSLLDAFFSGCGAAGRRIARGSGP